jgi:hypothetical protein
MFRPSILLENTPIRNGGLFPLCNRGFPIPCESSLCYLLPPYSHHHPDPSLVTTSPPSPLLLSPTQIYKTLSSTTSLGSPLYCSRYPLRSSVLCFNYPVEVPIQNAMLSVSIERPPPEPPPHMKQISCFGSLDLLPPSTQQLIWDPHPSLMLSPIRPPRKPPDKSGKLYVFSLVFGTLSGYVQVFGVLGASKVSQLK